MKDLRSLFLAIFGIVIGSSPVLGAQEGAKALFYGDTTKYTSEVVKTNNGTAIFIGEEVTSQTFPAPKAPLDNNQASANKPAEPKKIVQADRNPASEPVSPGLSYWIEVISSEGKTIKRVTASNEFNSGERFRVAITSNAQGYLYLLSMGTSGKPPVVLFPDKRINGGDNHVAAFADYRIPSGGKSFVMDSTPGEEKILVFFSKSRIHDIEKYVTRKKTLVADDARILYAYADTKGSKDILFEDDAEKSYVVAKSSIQGGTIAREIILRHR